jgi:hypothetical protein
MVKMKDLPSSPVVIKKCGEGYLTRGLEIKARIVVDTNVVQCTDQLPLLHSSVAIGA